MCGKYLGSREGISEEGPFGSASLSTAASKNIASEVAVTARTRGVHAVRSNDVDITNEDINGAAIVGENSPPGVWIVGTSAPGRELTGQASILSLAGQLTLEEK
eukprot:363568-Chlamydomonas_euryale.AAC.4